jgi:bifunctional DNA-binding transcriptional regulator/antitoxin component of YhaV-PrlF toxin-antitoxin module
MVDPRVRLGNGGQIAVPEDYQKALGWNEGEELVLKLEDGALRVVALQRAVKRAQALVARFVPGERSLADELIAERRREAAGE